MFDFMAGTNAFWNFIRLNFLTRIIGLVTKNTRIKKLIFPLISQIGITYPSNYIIINSSIGKVRAGVRMPFFIFSNGNQIFDYLSEPIFKILFFGNDEKTESQQINNIKIKIRTYAFKEIPTFLFEKETDFYILLRPDNHISYIGKEINKCRDMLNKISAI